MQKQRPKRWKRALAYTGAAAAIFTAGFFARDAADVWRRHHAGQQTLAETQMIKAPKPMADKVKRTPRPRIKMAKKPSAIPDLDWKRTHLIILNGRPHAVHDESLMAAIEAGQSNKVKGLYMAGIGRFGRWGPTWRDFGDGKSIQRADIVKLLSEVKANFREGDTLFLYITGNGERTKFEAVPGWGERIDHRYLPAMLAKNLQGKLVLLADRDFCSCFANALTSGSFNDITLITSARTNKAKGGHFSKRFWDAIKDKADPDKDGKASLKEAFSIGMEEHKDQIGSYRRPVRRIKRLEDVKDGVIMVTASWCPACKRMEPVFHTTNWIASGNLGFFMIDTRDAKTRDSLPTLIIKADGKIIAKVSGAMDTREFYGWLEKNGGMGMKAALEWSRVHGAAGRQTL